MSQCTKIAGVSPAVAHQGVVGTAVSVDALETGIDLKATISGRTPPQPPQLWLIGMARERLPVYGTIIVRCT